MLDARRGTSDLGGTTGPKYPFEKLEVWQLSVELAAQVYSAVRRLPRSEAFALGDQMRRAAVSVSLNIAEGRAADSEPEFRCFLGIALKSLVEVEACVRLGTQLGLVSEADAGAVCAVADKLEAKLRTLRSRLGSGKAAGRRSAP